MPMKKAPKKTAMLVSAGCLSRQQGDRARPSSGRPEGRSFRLAQCDISSLSTNSAAMDSAPSKN